MASKKPSGRRAPPLCSELHEDDGVDPREFFRAGKPSRRADRKTLQLCSQVRDALSYLLAGDSGDELLALFQVREVRPAPDASQLLVIVQPVVQSAEPVDPMEILQRLHSASGRLRAGVAAAITRKRAPKLLYQVVDAPWGREDRR
jgi:ribosome-binding factor A